MSCCCPDDNDILMVDSDGCFNCDPVPKVKGRFGLAWVSESPDCPCPEPVGWQVEFLDTPSKVEQKCQEMVRWINCPPLPRCDPCPPDELCSPCNPPRCNPCAPKCNPCVPKCGLPKCTCKQPQQQQQSCCCKRKSNNNKKCCCPSNSRREKRNCYPPIGGPCCRGKSPRRRSPQRCCTCGNDDRDQLPKCTCDDVPVKDTNEGVIGSSSGTYKTYKNSVIYPYVPQQVILTDSYDECMCSNFSANTLMIYKNNKQITTDTEYYESNDDCDCNHNQRAYNSPLSSKYQTPKYYYQVNNRKKQKDSNPNLYPDDPKQDDSGPPGRNQSNIYRDDDIRRSYYAEDENRKRTSSYSPESEVPDANETRKRSFMYEDDQKNNRRRSQNYYEEGERPDENRSTRNPRSSYEYNTTERDYRNYDSDCCNRNTCEFYNNQQEEYQQEQYRQENQQQQNQQQQNQQPSTNNRKNCREDCNRKNKSCNRDTCDYEENTEEVLVENNDLAEGSETKPSPSQMTNSQQQPDNIPNTESQNQQRPESGGTRRGSTSKEQESRNHLAEANSSISGHKIPSSFKEDVIVPEKVDENKKRSSKTSRPNSPKSRSKSKDKDKDGGNGDINNDAVVMQMQVQPNYRNKWLNAWSKCFKKESKATKNDPKSSKSREKIKEDDIKK